MFGTILADLPRLTLEQQERYRACYCGLCRTLKKEYGSAARLVLSYDMTFLILLLSSLYEPEEISGKKRCLVHPTKKRPYFENRFTSYAAAMNVALSYHKCLDDWNDEHSLFRLLEAIVLRHGARKAEKKYPRLCGTFREQLKALSAMEKLRLCDPDGTAVCFGRITESLFIYDPEDHWAPRLGRFGMLLGQFIYLSDALLDLEEDEKHHRFNPLKGHVEPGNSDAFLPILKVILGECAEEFEKLPLVQDVEILRNILYSGVWLPYEAQKEKKQKSARKRRDSLV